MSLWKRNAGRSRSAPQDVAERIVANGLFRTSGETAQLSERDTVAHWVHELVQADDQQVMVHRPWGTVAAVADKKHAVAVVMSNGEHSWFATPPGANADQPLTPDQVAHVVLDALTSPQPPAWPDWHVLV